MIILPKIKLNMHITAHPLGIQQFIQEQITYIKNQEKINNGPAKALIIGSSSGYGLSSRIALAFGSNTTTIGISTGGAPIGKRTGKAGFWNTYWFKKLASEAGISHYDITGDAFSDELKNKVVKYIKKEYGQIDLLVYSLASGTRINPETKEKIISSLKPINQKISGYTVDIITNDIVKLEIKPATEQEVANTIFVMGGNDWARWITLLQKHHLLAPSFKTIAYTYIGGKITKAIYRNGTIGRAKEDLENTVIKLNEILAPIHGQALISVSKAIVSKASVFIPSMILYGSCLFEIMMQKGTHESVIAHKYRLFKEMIYGNKTIIDSQERIRLDNFEMDLDTQKETIVLMNSFQNNYQQILNLDGAKRFINDFYQMNGFNYNLDYNQDVDINQLISDIK